MAGIMVAGSALNGFLSVLFDRMSSRQFLDFFKRKKFNNGLLRKFKNKMNTIRGVLDDAEGKQFTDQFVRKWLSEVKDTAYEADDFLDEIAYEALQSELEVASSQTSTDLVVNSFLSFNPFKSEKGEIETKLEEILEILDDLVEQMGPLSLERSTALKPWSRKTPTTSLLVHPEVYGRDGDKEAIMEMLLTHDANGELFGVIPIVGMGGVGKTTLAQLVYNDIRVQEWFQLKAWICVSEDFNVFKLTKDILKGFSSMDSDRMTEDQLHQVLQQTVKDKKVLLVLDDVWTDNQDQWDSLLTPFNSVAQGSKIIVTTRNESAASVRSTVPPLKLRELTEDDCWLVFAKHAFKHGTSDDHSDLEKIGKDIMRKCRGLPLAAKALGSLLRSTKDVEEWEKMLKSDIWDLKETKILPALRLSYIHLPLHLKQCFAYCALFPKDHDFQKDELVRLWMAEGFLVQLKTRKEMEEVGSDNFRELVSRSFFQPSSFNSSSFVMHDLIHDLAEFVFEEFYFRFEDNNSRKPLKIARHLLIASKRRDIGDELEDISEAQFARTLLLLKGCGKVDNKVLHDLLLKFGCLRVLSLPNCHNIIELPISIGSTKHLRCLDLSHASLTTLPEVLCTLYHLQTLILQCCKGLVRLPESIGNLKDLRYLDLSEKSIRSLPESMSNLGNLQSLILSKVKLTIFHSFSQDTKLQGMPSRMGDLTNLQKLTDFVLEAKSGASIRELGKLQLLQGALNIWNLENVKDIGDNLKAILIDKHLDRLQLCWRGDNGNSEHLLERLRPHAKVKEILIHGYGGASFSKWVGDSSFSNIKLLHLGGCKNCSSLPPLGQLKSLKDLSIAGFDKVVAIGPEFYGSCSTSPFRSLESLSFRMMLQWKDWLPDVEVGKGGAFPLLQQLSITYCPNLTKALPSHLPSLTAIWIGQCRNLVVSFSLFVAFNKFELRDDARTLVSFQLSSGLLHLEIQGFRNQDFPLNALEPLDKLPGIEEIEIEECDFINFPLHPFPNLNSLVIRQCESLESLSQNRESLQPTLNSLEISNCPNLKSLPDGGLLSKLRSLSIYACNQLFKGHFNWALQTLPSLSNFTIADCPCLESFPDNILLPPTLTSLTISDLQNLVCLNGLQHLLSLRNLKIRGCHLLQCIPEEGLPSNLTTLELVDLKNLHSLDCAWLRQLMSLEKLQITHCPMLQSFPEEGLASSISSLEIIECPSLAQRCQRENWPKICHIPFTKIYYWQPKGFF